MNFGAIVSVCEEEMTQLKKIQRSGPADLSDLVEVQENLATEHHDKKTRWCSQGRWSQKSRTDQLWEWDRYVGTGMMAKLRLWQAFQY